MPNEKQKQPNFQVCSFRHSTDVRGLIEDLSESENLDFTATMRQLVNAGLAAKYGVKIQANKVIDRGSVPSLVQVSRAS